MSSTRDGRQASGAALSAFDGVTAALSKGAERSVEYEPLAGFVPGDRVRITPPDDAFEVDGVPAGTAGTFEGVLRLRGLAPRAAISLDDNGETVFVRIGAVALD